MFGKFSKMTYRFRICFVFFFFKIKESLCNSSSWSLGIHFLNVKTMGFPAEGSTKSELLSLYFHYLITVSRKPHFFARQQRVLFAELCFTYGEKILKKQIVYPSAKGHLNRRKPSQLHHSPSLTPASQLVIPLLPVASLI